MLFSWSVSPMLTTWVKSRNFQLRQMNPLIFTVLTSRYHQGHPVRLSSDNCSGAARGKGVRSHPLSYPRSPPSIRTVTLCSLTTIYLTKRIILSGFGRSVMGLRNIFQVWHAPFMIYSLIICLRGYIQGRQLPILGLGGRVAGHERTRCRAREGPFQTCEDPFHA